LALGQVLTVEPFHGHVRQAAVLEHPEGDCLDDPGVVQVGQELAFTHQPLLFVGCDTGIGGDDLERNRALSRKIVGAVDDAYPTSTHLSFHDEPAAKAPALRASRLFQVPTTLAPGGGGRKPSHRGREKLPSFSRGRDESG
jgi:hypothetical protein